MADLDFDNDLRAMFASAPQAGDAEAFALGVDQGLDRMKWIRLGLVSTLGLLGVLIAWLMFGLSINDLVGGLNQMVAATGVGGAAADNASGWAAAVLLLALGVLLIRPVFSET